jgi:hypothetical protein
LGGGFFGALPVALSAFLSTFFPAGLVAALPFGVGSNLPGSCTINLCTPTSVMSCSCDALVVATSVRAGGAAPGALLVHAGAGTPWVETCAFSMSCWAGHWRYTDVVTTPLGDIFTCTLLACLRADSSKMSATSCRSRFVSREPSAAEAALVRLLTRDAGIVSEVFIAVVNCK